jgi:hypothetical protein
MSCSSGTEQLLHCALTPANAGDWTQTIDFKLRHPVSDIEFRLWVGERSDLSLNRLEILPVSGDEDQPSASAADIVHEVREAEDLLPLARPKDPHVVAAKNKAAIPQISKRRKGRA